MRVIDILRSALVALALGALVGGCATQQKSSQPSSVKAPDLGKQRTILNEGYSILYRDAGKLELSELLLYVKAESDAMKAIVTATSDVGGQLKTDLEKIAKDYPVVRLNLDPLPEMEKRKRAAVGRTRAKEFAPVVGKGGREYERTLLISFANGLNHERHLCRVMADEEPYESLKKFLLETGKKYDGLYERVMTLLEKEYFKSP